MGAGLRTELKPRIWLLSTIHGGILDPAQGVLMFFPHPPPPYMGLQTPKEIIAAARAVINKPCFPHQGRKSLFICIL